MTKTEYKITKKVFRKLSRTELLAELYLKSIQSELEILDRQMLRYEQENKVKK